MRSVIILLISSILFFGCAMPGGSPPSATPAPASEPAPSSEPQPMPQPIEQSQSSKDVIKEKTKCMTTGQDVEGPYYLEGAPYKIKIQPQDATGDIIKISGKVVDYNCNAIPNAIIDIWQTDSNGKYDMSNEFKYRGKLKTNTDGTYEFETIKPGNYPLGDSFRPAHIHIRVSSAGHRTLTTQIYFAGDPYLAPNDPCGSGCRSDDKTHIINLIEENSYFSGKLDIVLSKDGKKVDQIKTYGTVEKPEPPVPPQPQFEEVTPGKGAGIAFGSDKGPQRHRIKSARSQDGLTWTKDNFALADQASVPDAIIDKDGNVRVYYVDWKNQGVSVAINKNNTWKYYRVKIIPAGFFDGADPDVVLADNKYRIYFTKFDSPGSLVASINVAFSDNGIEFENEKIVYPREERITDADIFIAKDKWIMFISNGPRNVMATSSDGLKFTKQSELQFMGSVSNTIKVSNGYRMYYHKSSGMQPVASVYSAFSIDGLNWQEEGLRLEPSASEESVESPAVVKLSDGTYKMFYHSMIND